MSSIQSLKSSSVVRVQPGKAINLYGAARNTGQPLYAPASTGVIAHDIYGRPASQNTLDIMEASSAQYTQYPVTRHIQVENMHRPYQQICAAGLRGAGDFLGVGRDLLPQNLYGEGERGNMVRHYSTTNNAPWDYPTYPERPYYYWRKEQPYSLTHSADSARIYRG